MGLGEGFLVGVMDGWFVGLCVGEAVGEKVGRDGIGLGEGLVVGAAEGEQEGLTVGRVVGEGVGDARQVSLLQIKSILRVHSLSPKNDRESDMSNRTQFSLFRRSSGSNSAQGNCRGSSKNVVLVKSVST